MKRFKNEELAFQLVSDFGMTLELFIDTGEESIDRTVEYPLLKIYADNQDEEKFIELQSKNELIQIPVKKLKEVIELAEEKVHSEAWFDINLFNNTDHYL